MKKNTVQNEHFRSGAFLQLERTKREQSYLVIVTGFFTSATLGHRRTAKLRHESTCNNVKLFHLVFQTLVHSLHRNRRLGNSVQNQQPVSLLLILGWCACVCVCVCVCVVRYTRNLHKIMTSLYNNYFGGFNVYIFVDLLKRGVLTLVDKIRRYKKIKNKK